MNRLRFKQEGPAPELSLSEAVLYETLMDIACNFGSGDSERAFEACLIYRKVRIVEQKNELKS